MILEPRVENIRDGSSVWDFSVGGESQLPLSSPMLSQLGFQDFYSSCSVRILLFRWGGFLGHMNRLLFYFFQTLSSNYVRIKMLIYTQ